METEEQKTEQNVPKTDFMVKLKRHLGWKLLVVALIFLLGLSLFTHTFDFLKGGTGKAISVGKKASAEFYVMSQCPYGVQVENIIAPILKKLEDSVDFKVYFIANDNGDGTFSSLHGQPEVEEDLRQVCAMNIAPDKYLDYLLCINKDAGNAGKLWQECANKAKIDVDALKECAESSEGKKLLSASIAKSEAVNAQGSPTIYFNGQPYEGARDELSFMRAICKGIPEHPECKAIPECIDDSDCVNPELEGKCIENKCTFTEPVKFEVIVLNDKNCADCDTEQVNAVTKKYFKGATFRDVDVSSDEGKKLVEELKLRFVPAYLFEDKVTQTQTWQTSNIGNAFEKVGDYYKIKDEAVGATHWIDEKAKQAFFESLGIKLGDNKPQMDFFVMSYCPYGNQAEELIFPVYSLLKGKADFIPHYVWYSNYRGGGKNYCIDEESKYCSMHGVQEAHQDVRELCVAKYFGMDKWFEFALAMNKQCNSQNADTCWENVAKELNLDAEKIKQCEKDEALELAAKDKELGDALGVSGSPQIFIDGSEYNGGRSSSAYQSALCSAFDAKPTECNTLIKEESNTEAPSGGCGA